MVGCRSLRGDYPPKVELPCNQGCGVADGCTGRDKGNPALCRLENPSWKSGEQSVSPVDRYDENGDPVPDPYSLDIP